MFLKISKSVKSALIYLLISGLLTSSGIGSMIFFDCPSNSRMDSKMVAKAKSIQQPGSHLVQTVQMQRRLLVPSQQKQLNQTKNNHHPVNYGVNNHLQSRVSSLNFGVISEAEISMLARIIHAEAGGESLKGQVAVGAVLLNRIKSGRFPRTLAANIFRPGEFESVSNGYIWSTPTPASYNAARLAMNGWDPTYGALYFFNPAKTRSKWIWSRPIVAVIGQHNFAS